MSSHEATPSTKLSTVPNINIVNTAYNYENLLLFFIRKLRKNEHTRISNNKSNENIKVFTIKRNRRPE